MKKLLPCLLLLVTQCYAQDVKYARSVLDTLCSPAMDGRGYVNKGEKKAAAFIAGQFKAIGLEPVSKNYQQSFAISVNTFPSDMFLQADDKVLKPGIDYLVDPGSPGIKGTFKTVTCNELTLLNDEKLAATLLGAKDKFVVIEPATRVLSPEEKKKIHTATDALINTNNKTAGTLILTKSKLTWDGATALLQRPVFYIKVDSIVPFIAGVTLKFKNKFYKNYKTQNLLGFIKGSGSTDSVLVFTAHYDHLGRMGANTYFPGANDNASGITMLLNMAKYYKAHQPKYNMLFIAFSAEEMGLLGSKFYTENPLMPLSKIKFLINFDLAGTGDDGIQVVNGSVFKGQFERLTALNNRTHLMKEVKVRGTACNSDHCLFYQKGVPCFFIYTLGGITAYHDVFDRSQTLPFTAFENYFKLMALFIDGF